MSEDVWIVLCKGLSPVSSVLLYLCVTMGNNIVSHSLQWSHGLPSLSLFLISCHLSTLIFPATLIALPPAHPTVFHSVLLRANYQAKTKPMKRTEIEGRFYPRHLAAEVCVHISSWINKAVMTGNSKHSPVVQGRCHHNNNDDRMTRAEVERKIFYSSIVI